MVRLGIVVAAISAGLLSAWQDCAAQSRPAASKGEQARTSGSNENAGYAWTLPQWAPPPPAPASNPTTSDKAELGRRLFYDGRLAADSLRSCASCHQQDRGFSDATPFSWGVTGELTARNTMALANVGYASVLTWANPNVRSLEVQALAPLFGQHPIEMGRADLKDDLIASLSADPLYRESFAKAFPEGAGRITLDAVMAALAAFERTLVSARSPYDEYRFGGRKDAISESAKRGESLFFGDRLKCSQCHSGPRFNGDVAADGAPEQNYQNNGLYDVDGRGAYPATNPGVVANTGRFEDSGRFKVPSLRNISVTAPYMHDGSLPSLSAVLDHYAAGGRLIATGEANAGDGRVSPLKSPLVSGFQLTSQEKEDVIAFLISLTDEHFLTDPRFANPWK
jgi:cytochrome c peroxidase